jgi:diguanylate cyclase (GGDEF)-like protein
MSRRSIRDFFSQYYLTYFVLFLGLVVAGGVFWYQNQIQQEQVALRFRELTDSPLQLINQAINNELDRLEDVRDALELVAGQDNEKRVEQYIKRSLRGRNPRTMVLVDFPSRTSRRRNEGLFEPASSDETVEIHSYVYPRKMANRYPDSFVLNPLINQAMKRTLGSSNEQVAVPAVAVDDRYDPSVFFVVKSVETLEMSFGAFDKSRASPGFIVAEYDIRELVNRALKTLETDLKRNFRMEITRPHSAPNNEGAKAKQQSSTPIAVAQSGSFLRDESLDYVTSIHFADQRLKIRFRPTNFFLDRYQTRTPLLSAFLLVLVFLLIAFFLFQQTRMNRRIRKIAETDELTRLYARRFFMESFENELQQARRYDHSLSLLIVDIDHFKKINDTHGHQAGDAVLVQLAELLREMTRDSDVPARYGGEEFAVLLPETAVNEARELASRINEAVADTTFHTEAGELTITVSVGVASLNSDDQDIDDVIADADAALYQSKEEGRDQVTVNGDSDSD